MCPAVVEIDVYRCWYSSEVRLVLTYNLSDKKNYLGKQYIKWKTHFFVYLMIWERLIFNLKSGVLKLDFVQFKF